MIRNKRSGKENRVLSLFLCCFFDTAQEFYVITIVF